MNPERELLLGMGMGKATKVIGLERISIGKL